MSAERCIDENTAIRFVEGLLDDEQVRMVEDHVLVCNPCRELLVDAGAGREPGTESLTLIRGDSAEMEGVRVEASRLIRIGMVLHSTYAVERFIGGGGMGRVYAARHLRLPRRFAIKFLSSVLGEEPRAIGRIQREAHITSQLNHPNIVQVVDFNYTEDGKPFIVMELLTGQSLSHFLADAPGAREMSFVTTVMQHVTSALEAAHRAGVVHRDLKPSNLFLCADAGTSPFVKVLDFGISKMLSVSDDLTRSHGLVGTPQYMAPEQVEGEGTAVDHRADVFAMGIILYQLTTGQLPFVGRTVYETLNKLVNDEPAASDGWRQLGPPLRDVIQRALQKDPRQRQSSALELWEDIERAGRPPSPGPTTRRSATSRWRLLALGCAAALVILGGVLLVRYLSTDEGAVSLVAPLQRAARLRSFLPRASRDAEIDRRPHVRHAPSAAAEVKKQAPDTLATRAKPRRSRRRAGDRARHRRRRPSANRKEAVGTLVIQTYGGRDGQHLWSKVYLDGRFVGHSALVLKSVAAGRHTVEVRRAGYAARPKRVRVKAGRRQRVSFELQQRQ